jgi:TonB family protein
MLQRRGFPRLPRVVAAAALRGREARSIGRPSLETCPVVSATSASRSPEVAAPATGSRPAQPAADITAVTTHDEFLLELGQALGGQASVRPVDSIEAALESMSSGKRPQVLVLDARDLPNVRAAVESVRAARGRAVVVIFAEAATEKHVASKLKGTKVFAVLPTPVDARKTQAVLEGAIAAASAQSSVQAATPASAAAPATAAPASAAASPTAPVTVSAFQAQPAAAVQHEEEDDEPTRPRGILLGALAAVVIAAAAGAYWYFFVQGKAAPAARTAPLTTAPTPTAAAADANVATPTADVSILHGKVDELLEKARLAMHDRRFTEPNGDNALVYYRSAAAADPNNAEARDGLQRVAGVLASRLDEAVSAGRLDEAAQTLANFKAAAPDDARVGPYELKVYTAQITHAIGDGNLDRAAAYVRQAQQATSIPADQIAKWRADITHRQEDAKVQRLAALAEDRLHDGHLIDGDDSARAYWQQLQGVASGNPNTQRVAHELVGAYLRKARDAALAKNNTESERWLSEARAAGMTPGENLAFQRELSGARQKAVQAENDRVLQVARDRIRDGRLTDPAQDSAVYYLTQLQTSDPTNAQLADAGHELAGKLLDRARAAVLAGKSGDADIAIARRFGADPKDVLAVQQLQPPAAAGAAIDPALLAANLKRTRGVAPDYPPNALQQHQTGSVTLEFTVDTKGETRDVHVIEATPPGIFDQAAIAAVKHWRYQPMLVNGSVVEVPVRTRVRFELPK